MTDNIKHPSHYNAYGLETIEIIKNSMSPIEFQGYLKGNIIKYVSRYRLKNGSEDLKKADVYIKWLTESYEASTKPKNSVQAVDKEVKKYVNEYVKEY